MSYTGFIDSAINNATLIVVPFYLQEHKNFYSSSTFNQTYIVDQSSNFQLADPLISYQTSSSDNLITNNTSDSNYYYNILQIDIVNNRTSINTTPHFQAITRGHTLNVSTISKLTTFDFQSGVFVESTPSSKTNGVTSKTSIYIQNSEDELTIAYDVLSDKVFQTLPPETSTEDEGNNNNNNNNQNSLK